ncbi:gtpase-activating protein [Anaeramoeba flamelloides]|uniref:Gtpase-activating protein n=1 Tax=Anaeramoeba flamelloides TaxID=1746091 RepID=A0ABQ8XB82_9EUKA|nr:gtpase-activating protein [Anaeramoeba flamelloides]
MNKKQSNKILICSRVRDPPKNKNVFCHNCMLQNKYVIAEILCNSCNLYLCSQCDKQIHTLYPLKNHFRTTIRKEKQTNPICCDSCLKTNNELIPSFFCVNCKASLCGICNQQIHRIPLFSNHLVLPLQRIARKKKKKKKNTQIFCYSCQQMKKETVCDFYCKECNLNYCKNCAISVHKIPLFQHHKLEYFQPERKKQYTVGDDYSRDVKMLKTIKKKLPIKSEKLYSLVRELKIQMETYEFSFYEPIRLLRLQENEDLNEIKEERRYFKEIAYQRAYASFLELLYHNPQYFGKIINLITLQEAEKLNPIMLSKLYNHQFDPIEEKKLFAIMKIAFDENFAEVTDFTTLLRTNTPLTKLIVYFTRRSSSQKYLQDLLSEPLTKICENDELDLEIQPMRIWKRIQEQKRLEQQKRLEELEKNKQSGSFYNGNGYGNEIELEISRENGREEEGGKENEKETKTQKMIMTDEEAQEDPEVQEVIKKNLEDLLNICDLLLERLYKSVDKIPLILRKICYNIKTVIEQYFTNVDKYDVASKIGGFFMLRFVNVAIVVPISFQIVERQLNTKNKRNLTIIGKIIQILSNMKQIFNKKEQFLKVVEPFINKHKEKLTNFFFEITKCEEIQIDKSLKPYLDLSFNNFVITCTLNNIVFLHGLMKKYILQFKTQETDPLLRYLVMFGPMLDKQYEQSEDITMRISLSSQPNLRHFKKKKSRIYNEAQEGIIDLIGKLYPNFEGYNSFKKKELVSTIVTFRKENQKSKVPIPDKTIKRILVQLKNLRNSEILKTKTQYKKFLKEIANAYLYENREHKEIISDLNLLIMTSERLDQDYDAVRNQLDIYTSNNKLYYGKILDKSQLLSYANKKKKVGISYQELENRTIIVKSEIPKERQQHTIFKFRRTKKIGVFKLETYFGNVQEPVSVDKINLKNLFINKIDGQDIFISSHYVFNLRNLVIWLKKNLF